MMSGSRTTYRTSHYQEVLDDMYVLFRSANWETFQYGMSSDFSDNLTRIILDYGTVAIDALEKIIHMDDVNVEVAAEALIWTGQLDDKKTHDARLTLLEGALESPNVWIRDGASIGIDAMNDPAAIDSLQKAIDKEGCKRLRQCLKDVLTQLKDAR